MMYDGYAPTHRDGQAESVWVAKYQESIPDWFYGLSAHFNIFILLNGWICLYSVLD